ncbi:MAG: glycine zipper 2TM domain-containing protein [Alphaproteobacteria bacterium]|nr:glycine zipper 2TM domain-containing protein [Alphaproteobacteria bacterium]
MRRIFTLSAALVALALAGCYETAGNKQVVGTGAGAVLGGLAGSQVGSGSGRLWATGAGVLAGALLGSEVGKSLDRADLAYANRANQQAYTAPLGETIAWNNPDSGNRGTVTPVRDGYSTAGRYCREYQQEVYVGGKRESAYGTACQQPDGSWEIVK